MTLLDNHRPCACRKCKPIVTVPPAIAQQLSETWRAIRLQHDALATLLWGAESGVADEEGGVALKGIALQLDTLSTRLRAPQAPAPASANASPTQGDARHVGEPSPRSAASAEQDRR
jgi:hypothetical protein